MSHRRALETLYEELRNIDVFDRVHVFSTETEPYNEQMYAARQVRRQQLMKEIARLKADKADFWKPARLSGAIAVVCAAGYAMLRYSPK